MIQIILTVTLASLLSGELLLNPKPPLQEAYPSGVKEADKYYSTDKPSKEYALLKTVITAYDLEYNKLTPGIYPVEYSPQDKMLLIGNGEIIVKSPVFQIIETDYKVHSPSVNVAFIKNNKVFIVYKIENLEIQSFLYLPESITGN